MTTRRTNAAPTTTLPTMKEYTNLEALDLEEMANALMTPQLEGLEMLWTEQTATPSTQFAQAPQEAEVRNAGVSLVRKLSKAAPRRRTLRRPRLSAPSRRTQAKRKKAAEVAGKTELEQTTTFGHEPLGSTEDVREHELNNIIIAADIAFDNVIAVEIAGISSSPKDRFCLHMLRSLVMGMLQKAIDADPQRRFVASDITNLVFEELTKHNVTFR